MKLSITGNVPSQKNRKIISQNKATGRPFLRSAPGVLEWKGKAVQELQNQFRGYVVTNYPISLSVVVYFDNRRRHDLDNALATIMDTLVAAGILEDDNVNCVECVTVRYGGYDKQNPRVEVYLDE